ncbi:MAG: hypothetical protein C0621_08000 [Desulfuromonas sp.]|nr:MAG: hypothetical protein C0621_08000 [Desulfuromonas sp.]
MSEKFNAYEYIGVIAPGTVVVFAVTLVSPEVKQFLVDGGTTLGGLGLFLILSFIAGHLLQGLGNWFENIFWKCFGGMPTNWVRRESQKLLAKEQRKLLTQKISELHPAIDNLEQVDDKEWYSLTREIYAMVKAADRAARVDAFNRNYGLLRGVAVSFLVTTAGTLFVISLCRWKIYVALVVCTVLAVYRMYRFAVIYARELFVQFIRI